jgi:hypothetical protein
VESERVGIGAYNPAVAPAAVDLSHHRGDYGFDAPFVTILLGAGGLALLVCVDYDPGR